MILESTKEYVCNAVVTVVNHLGSVSSNLNEVDIGFSQAELRIDSLEQRFLAYQLYSEKIALTKTRWSKNFPKSQSRYLSTAEKSRHDMSKNNKNMVVFEAEELPLFFYTYSHHKDSSENGNQVVPVRDTILEGGKGQKTSTFHFQQSSSIQQQKKNGQIRRLSGSRNGHIMSLIRPSKRPS
ncbi:Probable protein ABIL5 [Linum perenne]